MHKAAAKIKLALQHLSVVDTLIGRTLKPRNIVDTLKEQQEIATHRELQTNAFTLPLLSNKLYQATSPPVILTSSSTSPLL